MYLCIMECYLCKKETNYFSNKYVEKVCLECGENLEQHRNKYDELIQKYMDNHALCPKCGVEGHFSTTLTGYILDMDHPDEFKDLNNCVCYDCGDKHTTHERIPNKSSDRYLIREIKNLVKNHPNDTDLGRFVRNLIDESISGKLE